MNRTQKTGLGVVAATLLVGLQIGSVSSTEAGVPSPHQLMQIQKMVRANKIEELVGFLEKNPHLTAGPGPMSQHLRDLVAGVRAGHVFSFSPRAIEALRNAGGKAFERAGGKNRDSLY